ncbi:MAG TPA: hypothetical protein VK190_04700 [Pseudoneobacillus sp.]|nr:hypothetical protein [Pseudoneobacillus sp.]
MSLQLEELRAWAQKGVDTMHELANQQITKKDKRLYMTKADAYAKMVGKINQMLGGK